MIDITQIVVLIILILFAIISKFLVPMIRDFINANISAKDREKILFWTDIAVRAAEQLAKAGKIERDERKQHVIDFLKEHNITVDMDVIKEVMEACVNDLPPMVTKDEKKQIQEGLGTITAEAKPEFGFQEHRDNS